jgi:hypothetical protein
VLASAIVGVEYDGLEVHVIDIVRGYACGSILDKPQQQQILKELRLTKGPR